MVLTMLLLLPLLFLMLMALTTILEVDVIRSIFLSQ